MTLTPKVQKLLQFSLDHNLEIVSYGLAPNPNGFCYEVHDDETDCEVKRRFEYLLNTLTEDEIGQVRKAVFAS